MKSTRPKEYRPGQSLCFRCEHRAGFLEGGFRPRMECGEVSSAVGGCYMYRPVQPVVLAPREGDPRPVQGPAMISARMGAAGLLDAHDICIVTEEVRKDGKKAYVSLWELTKKPKKKYPKDDKRGPPYIDGIVKEEEFLPGFDLDKIKPIKIPKSKKAKEKNIWVDVKKRQGTDKREPLMGKSKK